MVGWEEQGWYLTRRKLISRLRVGMDIIWCQNQGPKLNLLNMGIGVPGCVGRLGQSLVALANDQKVVLSPGWSCSKKDHGETPRRTSRNGKGAEKMRRRLGTAKGPALANLLPKLPATRAAFCD